uniref:Transmembrane protein 45B n=1 Tax=Pelusios castaneus TaxID=367368 RepID=A0A8C8VQL7_9SAUR
MSKLVIIQIAFPHPTVISCFIANALRGTFFMFFGLWWSVKYPLKYLSRRLNEDKKTMICICLCYLGMLAEQFVPNLSHVSVYSGQSQSWEKLANWQYMTMYFFYGLSGIVDVLSYSPLKLTLGLDRLLLSVALCIEGFLFCFQDYNNASLDQHLYSLLVIAVFGGALCTLMEVFLRDHAILEFFRTSFFILQGSWFWQIGFVLSPPWGGPGWDQTDRGNFMLLTMGFFWHYAAALLITTANSIFSRWYVVGRGNGRAELENN